MDYNPYNSNSRLKVTRTLSFVVSLLLLLCFTQVVHAGLVKGKPNPKLKSNLVIGDFTLYGVSDRLLFIKRGFAEIVQLSLLPYQNVNVIPRTKLWETLRKMPEIPREDWSSERIFESDILSHSNVNATHLLTGEIYNVGRILQLNAKLVNLDTALATDLDPLFFPEEEIFQNTKSLAKDVNLQMLKYARLASGERELSKVFICISKTKNPLESLDALIATDLSISLEETLKQEFDIEELDVEENNPKCVANAQETDDWQSESTAIIIEAIVTVTKKDNTKIIDLKPRMVLNNPSIVLSMVEFTQPRKDYRKMREGFLKISSEYIGKALNEGSITELAKYSVLDNTSKEKKNILDDLKQGKLLYEQGEEFVAAKYFKRVIDEDKNNPAANYYLGKILIDYGYPEKAEEYLRKALNGDNNYIPAYELLAEAYEKQQNYHQAREQYNEILKRDVNNVNASINLGNIYLGLEDKTKANYYLRRALSNDENNVESLMSLANLAIRNNQYEEALDWYTKATKADKNYEKAKMGLANVYHRYAVMAQNGGDIEKAIEYYSKQIEYLGRNMSPESIEARIQWAQLSLQQALENKTKDVNLAAAINELVVLSSAYNKRSNNRGLVFADIDLILANLMENNYQSASKLSLKSISTHWDNLELRVFARVLNIASKAMAKQEANTETKLLKADLAVLERRRKRIISDQLNRRYNMITEIALNKSDLPKDSKDYVQKITNLAKGIQ